MNRNTCRRQLFSYRETQQRAVIESPRLGSCKKGSTSPNSNGQTPGKHTQKVMSEHFESKHLQSPTLLIPRSPWMSSHRLTKGLRDARRTSPCNGKLQRSDTRERELSELFQSKILQCRCFSYIETQEGTSSHDPPRLGKCKKGAWQWYGIITSATVQRSNSSHHPLRQEVAPQMGENDSLSDIFQYDRAGYVWYNVK